MSLKPFLTKPVLSAAPYPPCDTQSWASGFHTWSTRHTLHFKVSCLMTGVDRSYSWETLRAGMLVKNDFIDFDQKVFEQKLLNP